jgi:hypothetical protein
MARVDSFWRACPTRAVRGHTDQCHDSGMYLEREAPLSSDWRRGWREYGRIFGGTSTHAIGDHGEGS